MKILSPVRRSSALAVPILLAIGYWGASVFADSTLQTLPFSQNWTNTSLISVDDDWAAVPGIVGYRGDGLVSDTAVNPQTVLADGSATPVDVNANQTNPNTFFTGGVAEFQIANPVVALNGSGTADAPHLVLHLNTSGRTGIQVSCNLRDLDASADDAIQSVALQYRVGSTGSYTNLPAAFVADATTGPNLATLVTPVSVTLPAAADNQPQVFVRIITTNAAGNDEWVGVDDISVTTTGGEILLSGTGSAQPNPAFPGGAVTFTVNVTPQTGATPSTGIQVRGDLSSLGQGNNVAFTGNGNTFTLNTTLDGMIATGPKSIPVTITDAQGRTANATISFSVSPAVLLSATGSASPASGFPGDAIVLTVNVTPQTGANPSTGIQVRGDLSSIGQGNNVVFTGNGTVFTLNTTVGALVAAGAKSIPVTVTDLQGRTVNTTIAFTVSSLTITQIHEIQGSTARSPLIGQVTTRGIVTFRTSNGFYLQSDPADADANVNTSQGLFVFTGGAPAAVAAPGTKLRVTGTVTEFTRSSGGRPITQLTGVSNIQEISANNPLPAAVTLTPNFACTVTDLPGVDAATERYECVEGMLVTGTFTSNTPTRRVDPSRTAGDEFYSPYVVPAGTARPRREPGVDVIDLPTSVGAGAVPRFDVNAERLLIDTRVGDPNVGTPNERLLAANSLATIGNVTGPLDYEERTYTIRTSTLPTLANSLTQPIQVRPATADEYTVASFNIQQAQAPRTIKAALAICNVLRSPDILGLEEVFSQAALNALVSDIQTTCGIQYSTIFVQADDSTRNLSFLYRTAKVTSLGFEVRGVGLTYDRPVAGSPDDLFDRDPLVFRAQVGSRTVTVVANHLRSLVSATGNPTAPNDAREKRRKQAVELARILQDLQSTRPNDTIVSVGDYNAYNLNDGYTDSLGLITGNPTPFSSQLLPPDPPFPTILTFTPLPLNYTDVNPDFTNLIDSGLPGTTPLAQQYSYTFDGNIQAIDHILVNRIGRAAVRGFQFARVNADFSDPLYGDDLTTALRASDHDAPVAYFDLTPPSEVITGVRVTSAGLVYNPIQRTYRTTLTITNTGTTAIAGPLQVVLAGLPQGVTVTNATGQSAGGPFVTVPVPSLGAGQSVAVEVRFQAPSTAAITYTPQVLSGSV